MAQFDDAERVAKWMNEQAQVRRCLTDKDMLALQAPGVELMHRMKLKGAAGYAWLFTIKGLLDHELVSGCFFRDQCMVIIGMDKNEATTWAHNGLLSTIEELRAYWLDNAGNEPLEATVITGGRKAGTDATPLIYRNPELYEYLKRRFDVKNRKPN